MTELQKSILEDAKHVIHNDDVIGELSELKLLGKEVGYPFWSNGIFYEAIFEVNLKSFTKIKFSEFNSLNGIYEEKYFNIPLNKE